MPGSPESVANLWEQVAADLKARRPVVVATVVRDSGSVPRRSGAKMLVYPDRRTLGSIGGGLFELIVVRDALAALDRGGGAGATHAYSFNPKGAAKDAFGAVCGGRVEVFLEVVMPPDRLLIVGGGHCGRALARAASLLGFSIVVADDREEYSRPQDYPYPGVESVLHLPPDFAGLPVPDAQTYVALVSKGFMTDEAALRRVIDSPAAYIGMIGSVKKRETVYDKLRADGIGGEKLARIFAPIGLEVGAETPEEIAVSILAQIIQERARRRATLASQSADAEAANADSVKESNGSPERQAGQPERVERVTV